MSNAKGVLSMRYIERIYITEKETTDRKEKWAKDVKHAIYKISKKNAKRLHLISNQRNAN